MYIQWQVNRINNERRKKNRVKKRHQGILQSYKITSQVSLFFTIETKQNDREESKENGILTSNVYMVLLALLPNECESCLRLPKITIWLFKVIYMCGTNVLKHTRLRPDFVPLIHKSGKTTTKTTKKELLTFYWKLCCLSYILNQSVFLRCAATAFLELSRIFLFFFYFPTNSF